MRGALSDAAGWGAGGRVGRCGSGLGAPGGGSLLPGPGGSSGWAFGVLRGVAVCSCGFGASVVDAGMLVASGGRVLLATRGLVWGPCLDGFVLVVRVCWSSGVVLAMGRSGGWWGRCAGWIAHPALYSSAALRWLVVLASVSLRPGEPLGPRWQGAEAHLTRGTAEHLPLSTLVSVLLVLGVLCIWCRLGCSAGSSCRCGLSLVWVSCGVLGRLAVHVLGGGRRSRVVDGRLCVARVCCYLE